MENEKSCTSALGVGSTWGRLHFIILLKCEGAWDYSTCFIMLIEATVHTVHVRVMGVLLVGYRGYDDWATVFLK